MTMRQEKREDCDAARKINTIAFEQTDEVQSRLEDLEDVTLDEERSEVEDLIESGKWDDAESMIYDLESERT